MIIFDDIFTVFSENSLFLSHRLQPVVGFHHLGCDFPDSWWIFLLFTLSRMPYIYQPRILFSSFGGRHELR